jgi:hypothetical protein
MSKNIDTLKAVKGVGYIGQVYTLKREYGDTPWGNKLNGRWVLRELNGEWVDCDRFRYDLAEKHSVKLVGDPNQ